jgi:hypothetical protein
LGSLQWQQIAAAAMAVVAAEMSAASRQNGTPLLAEVPYSWKWSQRYHFNLELNGTMITGSMNGTELIRYNDSDAALLDGGIALVCEEGLIMTDEVKVTAA